MKKRVSLILFGGLSPLLGVLIYWIQLQINPHGLTRYIIIQSIITLAFLLYFFLCGYFILGVQQRKDDLLFFLFPMVLVFINIFFEKLQGNIIIGMIVLGVSAPFHYVLPYLYFPVDKFSCIPKVAPIIICLIFFKMGGCINSNHKENPKNQQKKRKN